ncbi:hypothetical protein VNO77_18211 [Canavalia gladiata]|uniref:Uncharacterized protein n=1 Tax=Canavalia gladiata TaxID=3824 RepID=A0AAN9LQD2_CANGL
MIVSCVRIVDTELVDNVQSLNMKDTKKIDLEGVPRVPNGCFHNTDATFSLIHCCSPLGAMTLIRFDQKRGEHDVNVMGGNLSLNPLFRSESFGHYYPEAEHNYTMMEKRQLFLRSYQFCRKKSFAERIKGSLVRAKKIVWLRLRSATRLRRLVFSRFRVKCGFYYRRRRFSRLLNGHNRKSESCFW